jgi:ppGpp synthetase/RelA/SpoT-type nucleotidyltranferase
VQIRTVLQDLWANLSEALDRVVRRDDVKYGQGPPEVIRLLGQLSLAFAGLEAGHPLPQAEREAIRDALTTAVRALAG